MANHQSAEKQYRRNDRHPVTRRPGEKNVEKPVSEPLKMFRINVVLSRRSVFLCPRSLSRVFGPYASVYI